MKFPILDLETTGLTINPGSILEVSIVIMDHSFNVCEEYTRAVAHTPVVVEEQLNKWARETHTKSGLLDECYNEGKFLGAIENHIVSMLDDHFGSERPILTGSSIHWDRRWIAEYMPKLHERLHYRMLDVSALWEWLRIFHGIERPDIGPVVHRGMPDTRGSAKLLKMFGEKVVLK